MNLAIFRFFYAAFLQYLLQENMKKDDKKSEALILKQLSLPLLVSAMHASMALASLVCGGSSRFSSFVVLKAESVRERATYI